MRPSAGGDRKEDTGEAEGHRADQEGLWEAILQDLRERLGVSKCGMWCKKTELMGLEESELVIGVPNAIVKQYLAETYKTAVQQSVCELMGRSLEVRFDVAPKLFRQTRSEVPPTESDGGNATEEIPRPDVAQELCPSGPTGGFGSLVITDCNRLAFLAARELAEKPAPQFDFLLVMGRHGTGKTALLGATAHSARKRGDEQVEHVRAESWFNEFLSAIESRKTKKFRRRYRNCDVLLVDGIEFVEGKPAAQNELLYTARDLLEKGNRLVFSSSVHPHDMKETKPVLCNLLEQALWVELRNPPREQRELMARQMAAQCSLDLGHDAIAMLAEDHGTSVRELNAAVESIAAFKSLTGAGKLDMRTVRQALKATSRSRTKVVDVEDIARTVAGVFSVEEQELKGKSRRRKACRARQVAMYLSRELTGESLSDIGRYFGERTHSTVRHSIDRATERFEEEPETEKALEECRAQLASG
jgi:chromosomal replication initiator protein